MASNVNKATVQLALGIAAVLAAGAYLRAHPAGTVGSSDRAPSGAQMKASAFAKGLDEKPAPPSAEHPMPARVTPTSSFATRGAKTDL